MNLVEQLENLQLRLANPNRLYDEGYMASAQYVELLPDIIKALRGSDQDQPTHFGCFREAVPGSPMIKEASYFLEQKEESLRDYPHEKWFEDWEPIYDCKTVGEARRKIAEKYGVTLSHIYSGEI